MKSITPDRCQKELAEVGGTDFGFAFGELARFRVSVFKQRGNVAMVLRQIPNRLLTFEQLGTAAGRAEALPAAARSVSGHRPDRLRQEHDAGQHDQLHQRNARPSHHHGRRPDRVLPHEQAIDRESARSGRRRAELFRSLAARVAARPRRDPRRRNARSGNDRSGDHAPPKRATSCSARCTPPVPKAP